MDQKTTRFNQPRSCVSFTVDELIMRRDINAHILILLGPLWPSNLFHEHFVVNQSTRNFSGNHHFVYELIFLKSNHDVKELFVVRYG